MTRLSGLWRLATASVGLLLLGAMVSARAVEVHIFIIDANGQRQDVLLDANSPAPIGHLPVLFVHGHNPGDEATNPNYQNQLAGNGQQFAIIQGCIGSG